MSIPFTIDQFLTVFRDYNLAIWPAQIIGYLLAAIALILVVRRRKHSDRSAAAILALFWIWTGVVYHIVFFSSINRAAILFGSLFILQGVVLTVFGVIRGEMVLVTDRSTRRLVAYAFVLYAAVLYPLLATVFGHVYPEMPVFPITPCPLTIFTFGILLLMTNRVRWYLWIIPFVWSLIGSTAAFRLSMYEDFGLLVSGLLGLILILSGNRIPRHTVSKS
jgi:hypothetical protein